jgi:hypothetical protein
MMNDKNAAAMEKGLEPIYGFYDRYDHASKCVLIDNTSPLPRIPLLPIASYPSVSNCPGSVHVMA